VPLLDPRSPVDRMEVDQDPPQAVDLTSSPSPSPKKKKSIPDKLRSGAIVRSYFSRDSAPFNLPLVESVSLPNLPGLIIFGRGPMTRVDSIVTTNEQSNSLWGPNLDPQSVYSGVGRLEFPSAYDAKLLNTVGAEGTTDSCTVLLGRCMAMVSQLKKATSDSTKVRSLEAQLEDVILSKDRVTKELTLELEQS